MPQPRDPAPVYIVAPPPPKERVNVVELVVAIIVVAIIVVAGANYLEHPLASDPAGAPIGVDATSRPTVRPGTTVGPRVTQPAATVDPGAYNPEVDQAIQAALDRQIERMNAKLAQCNGLQDAAWDKCNAQYDALDKQWDALDRCTTDLTAVAQVAACEQKVGIKH